MWKILSLSMFQRNENSCLEGTLTVRAKPPFGKEIRVDMSHGSNQPSQQKLGPIFFRIRKE